MDNLDAALTRMRTGGFAIKYETMHEPRGVGRFLVRDPFGRLMNILAHGSVG